MLYIMSVIFKDTGLVVIVKNSISKLPKVRRSLDEFVSNIVPYVECAGFVDTGSTDGTTEELWEYSLDYDNMGVYFDQFNGFANARNFGMEMVNRDYDPEFFLVLDDDEKIDCVCDEGRILELYDVMKKNPDLVGVGFKFFEKFAIDGSSNKHGNNHNIRLFRNLPGLKFKDNCGLWEHLHFNDEKLDKIKSKNIYSSGLYVTHYLHSEYEDLLKYSGCL